MPEENNREKVINVNKSAGHNFIILDKLEAGISLVGTEVKSVKEGKVSLKEGYCYIANGEIFLKEDQFHLVDQITMFPKTRHDDLIDAFAYILEIMFPADSVAVGKWEGSPLSDAEKAIWDHKEKLGTRKVRRTKKRM